MNINRYTTLHIRKNEYQFFSEGGAGRFEMRICFTLIDAERELYNLVFGIYNPFVDQLDDKTELKNGDTNKILATVGHQTIKFLKQNPTASIVAAGSIVPGKLAIRTRKYQMGINSNYDLLSESHKV